MDWDADATLAEQEPEATYFPDEWKVIAKALTKSNHKFTTNDRKRIYALEDFAHDLRFKLAEPEMKVGEVYNEVENPRIETDKLYFYKTSLGSIRQFKVVFVSPVSGVSYLKEVNSSGKLYGPLRVCSAFTKAIIDNSPRLCSLRASFFDPHVGGYRYNGGVKWALDRSYLDSLLLGEDVDVHSEHRTKKQLREEISAHNTKVRICLDTAADVKDFITSLKPGDIFWQRHDVHHIVQKIVKDSSPSWWKVHTLNSDQRRRRFTGMRLTGMRLYREQPRSFIAELKKMEE